jgi:hypothetical protein
VACATNIVGLAAAAYCTWVVPGSLEVDGTKRGLSNYAGSRGRCVGVFWSGLGGSPFGYWNFLICSRLTIGTGRY